MKANNQKLTSVATVTTDSRDETKVLQLVQRCKSGEVEALEEFFSVYAEDIYNFPIRVFNFDEDDAGDFFLFAFERLRDGRRMQTFSGGSLFRTWLYTVLRNLVIDWMRSRHELDMIPVDRIEIEQRDEVAGLSVAEEVEDTLSQKIKQIPMMQRVIFKLVYLYYVDLSADEIEFLVKQYGLTVPRIVEFVMFWRQELSGREEQNLKKEDALSRLYLAICRLKEKKDYMMAQPVLSMEQKEIVAQIDVSLQKKYVAREKILTRRKKGLLIARTSYRIIAEFLNIPSGSISVYMGKISSFLTNDRDISRLI